MPQIRNQTMETARKCDGQCQNCNLVQQTYCASVRLHAFMEHEPVIFEKLEHIEKMLAAFEKTNLIIAQGGDGAVKVSEESTI